MSPLPIAVVSGFLLAAAAPILERIDRRLATASFVLLPLALAAWFLSLAPGVIAGSPVTATVAWVPELGLEAAFSVDGLGLLFALLICGIGALVVLYADRYLSHDPGRSRFHPMLLAFMASMLGLVLADNLLLVFVFWGLTGITSFLLIGYEHEKETSRKAASQALIVTVAGELAMMAGLVLLAQLAGTYSLSALPAAGEAVRADSSYPLVLLLILAGAVTKSAQFPFHFWLPGAMAAPTPVSAYLHSATMVTAGVYLLSRLAPTLGDTVLWTTLLMGFGGVTMLIGGALSLRERDLKRILAYSTVGALGFMVLLVGTGTVVGASAAMALLLAHALYKGALFLVTGAVDHETGSRDVDRLAGLRHVMPVTALAAGLAALSMAGVPPLLGFAGKELGIKSGLDVPAVAILVTGVVVAAGAATAAVAGIAGFAPFLGRLRVPREGVHEAPWPLWLAPLALGGIGLFAGLLPELGAGPLVAAAADAISTVGDRVPVAPWYGVDQALILSVLSLAAAAVLFARRRDVRVLIAHSDPGHRIGPARAYAHLEQGMNTGAKLLTGILQNGRLRVYLLTVVVTLIVLEWTILIGLAGLPPFEMPTELYIWELGVATAIVAGAFVAVRTESRLSAVTALGIVGYGIAVIYLLFGAPDLAMAQILIETLTVLLFVLVFYHLPRFSAVSGRASRLRDAVIALAAGSMLTILVLATSTGPHDPISTFFAEVSQPIAHGRNVVNVILVDFRGLDTLGEIAVLAVAGFGVYALLKLRARTGGDGR
jgi:multicomponent Na+:H+ antiporter subunit A